MIDSEPELIELCSFDDSETEKEDNKKEKDNNFRMYLYLPEFDLPEKISSIMHTEEFLIIHHPEITTPPPEYFFS